MLAAAKCNDKIRDEISDLNTVNLMLNLSEFKQFWFVCASNSPILNLHYHVTLKQTRFICISTSDIKPIWRQDWK